MRTIGNTPVDGEVRAVASGALANGDTVIVNANGTVSVVDGEDVSQAVGSASVFESGAAAYLDSAFDSTSNKFIVAYQDSVNSQKGTAVVGTVDASNNTISFGTPVVFQNSGVEYCAVVYDSTNDKIVIFYHDFGSTNYGKAIVGTVSGTSISFGTAVVFASVVARTNFAAFDSGNGKVVNVYRNSSANNTGDAIVGTVSGTSISFGSIANWSPANQGYGSVTYIGSSKFLIGYSGSSEYGNALIATLSGTSLSYGSSYVFRNSSTFDISSSYDSSTGKVVIVSRDNSSNGKAIVASISGTAITYGSDVTYASVVSSGDTSLSTISYDSTNDKMVISYQDSANSNYGTLIVGTVSGTSISFGTPIVFETGSTNYTVSSFDSDSEKVVIGYRDQSNSNNGTAVVFQNANLTTNLTSENYIGIAKGAAADTAVATVQTGCSISSVPLTGFNLSGASYDSLSFSAASQSTTPTALTFNGNGTKMYVGDYSSKILYQYSLSSAFDVSSASYDNVSLNVSSYANFFGDVLFNDDGTKLYILADGNRVVVQYAVSSAYNISTASHSSNFSISGQTSSPQGIAFNSNGSKMFIVDYNNDAVYQYSLSSSYNTSTASYDSVSFSVSSQISQAQGLAFNGDGLKMYVGGNATDKIFEYDLSSAYAISGASYSGNSFSVASQETNPSSIAFNNDGTKMYVVGYTNDSVYQYSTSKSLTAGQQYFVQVDGTLGLTPADPSVFAGTAVSATKLIVKG